MKAIVYERYGPPDVLVSKNIDQPVVKDNEVLVKNLATTVTSGDYRLRSLDVPTGFKMITKLVFGFNRPRKPVLGMEFAGIVETVGQNVTSFNCGDRVFGTSNMGAYAEYLAIPEKEPIATLPKNMSFTEAVAVPFGALSSLVYLRDFGKIKAGDKVLVNGASGGLGTYAVQLAKYYGATVTGVCSTANVSLVKSLGADAVIDYTKEDFSTNGETYDIIFDTVGKITFAGCKASLTSNGRFLLAVAGLPDYLNVLRTAIFSRQKAVAGVAVFKKKDLIFVKELIEVGRIKAVVDRQYPIADIVAAHRYVDKGHKKGSVVITIAEPPK